MAIGAAVGLFILALLIAAIAAVKALMVICPPNEVLVLSGRTHKGRDGQPVGYRVIFGGRALRIPIIERASRLSLNAIEIPVSVKGAYAKGGIALNVDAVAIAKISSNPARVGNAIERFLDSSTEQVAKVTKETLEGHLRGVLARLTPEEVNDDRLKFASELEHETEADLHKLGIDIDTLKISHVTDELSYLDSIGREAIANVVKAAEIAESDAERAAEQEEASNRGRANVAMSKAEANIARMRNELRRVKAELEAQVNAEDEKTKAAARQARAEAEFELQRIRTDLEAMRLQVEQVLPAEANQRAAELAAKGSSAELRERGRAASESLGAITAAWKDAGPDAAAIVVLSDLDRVLGAAMSGLGKINPNKVNVIDNGDGTALVNYFASYPAMLSTVLESLRDLTGVDVPALIQTASGPPALTSPATPTAPTTN